MKVGVEPVVLGNNVAAQLHAEDALRNCFTSHWGLDGLKPYMRYTLAGGYQSNEENVSGISYCYSSSGGYAETGPIEEEIRDRIDGFMGSPEHRESILRPRHRQVNIGLAFDLHNVKFVLHFEGDHVEYGVVPVIEDGVLTFSGTVKDGFAFLGSRDLRPDIFYDPPPNSLTRGQAARTDCYDYGQRVASLRPPLTGNSYYPDDEWTDTFAPCANPYDVPTGSPPPQSPQEANDLWQKAYEESHDGAVTAAIVRWVTASDWHAKDSSFSLKADLSDVLGDHGPGVYTIIVWGWRPDADTSIVISEYSIFHGITPPDIYPSDTLPTPTPVATVTPAPTGPDIEAEASIASCTFYLEVADTPEERRRGLMGRESLGEDRGMLFVFQSEQTLRFWMRNTLIPLDILFVDEDLVVVDVQTMRPEHEAAGGPLPTHTSAAPARYAIEINEGMAAKCGIGPGASVVLREITP